MNGNVKIVGTAHVSKDSASYVSEMIEEYNPDIVALELDSARFKQMEIERSNSNNTDGNNTSIKYKAKDFLKSPFKHLILKIMSYSQSKIADNMGVVSPGEDMWEAYKVAEANNIPVAMIDKDLSKTFAELMNDLSIIQKIKYIVTLTGGTIAVKLGKGEDIISQIMNPDGSVNKKELSDIKEIFRESYPTIYKHLIEKRNEYMATNIKNFQEQGYNVLAVVGAAHKDGIEEQLSQTD